MKISQTSYCYICSLSFEVPPSAPILVRQEMTVHQPISRNCTQMKLQRKGNELRRKRLKETLPDYYTASPRSSDATQQQLPPLSIVTPVVQFLFTLCHATKSAVITHRLPVPEHPSMYAFPRMKRETKTILDNFLRLNTQLEKKQNLELEIEHLSGKLQMMELKPGDEDPESREKIDKLKEELNEKIDELKDAENYNEVLITRGKKFSDELQEARVALINSLQGFPGTTSSQTQIGIKKVGELDRSVFLSLCKRKFPAADPEAESARLCSKWQNEIENQEWQPFKVIIVDGKASEALNEGDRKLQELKELGEGPYAAVTKALMELKDGNGGRKDPYHELWNYKEDRKANMVEGARLALKLHNASKSKGKRSR